VQNKTSNGEFYKLEWCHGDPPARTHVHGDEASTTEITKIQLQAASFSEPRVVQSKRIITVVRIHLPPTARGSMLACAFGSSRLALVTDLGM